MFRVNDPVSKRQAKILGYLEGDDQFIAVLLAAADFERTIRRAIIALGKTPTAVLAQQLGRRGSSKPGAQVVRRLYRSSLDEYGRAWNNEVLKSIGDKASLFGGIIKAKQSLEAAYNLRHELIHGDRGVVSRDYAAKQVQVFLEATAAIDAFAKQNGADLTKRLKVRRKAWA
jgi:hypothetical protein